MASNRKDAALVRSESASAASNLGETATSQAPSAGGVAPPRTGVVGELMREFSRRERLVLMLRYTEELTVAEIAAVLEIAATEVERMLESIAERVRRKIAPAFCVSTANPAGTYMRSTPRLA